MIERIAILGTGLLGTSVGLALRAAGFRGSIVGWDKDRPRRRSRWLPALSTRFAAEALQAAHASQLTLLAVPVYATSRLDGATCLRARFRPSGHRCGAVPRRRFPRRRPGFSTAWTAQLSCPAIRWQARNLAARSTPTRRCFAGRSGCLPTIRAGTRAGSVLRTPRPWSRVGVNGLRLSEQRSSISILRATMKWWLGSVICPSS